MDSIKKFTDSQNNSKNIAIFVSAALFSIILITSFISLTLNENKKADNSDNTNISKPSLNISNHSLIYGTWSQDHSLIKSLNLQTGTEHLIAKLAPNIKKVTVLDQDRFLYIDETNIRDHGTKLSIYSLSEQTSSPIVEASENFGIDDYVISPNKQFVSLWEVQVSSESGVLSNGKSRVYTVDLQNLPTKYLLYDEQATPTTPIHYPRAILDNGDTYLDTFLPNSGAGWAYGMSVSNFTGTKKDILNSMQNGTYGTQPSLSPDGKSLIFAGYDQTQGPGTNDVNGFRRALVSPNTIEIFDTATQERKKLPGISSNNTYTTVDWDPLSGNIIYHQIGQTTEASGMYMYDIAKNSITPIASSNNQMQRFIAQLSDEYLLSGNQESSLSNGANLGAAIDYQINNLTAFNMKSQKEISIAITDPLIQFITVVPNTSFPDFADFAITQDNQSFEIIDPNLDRDTNQLQLLTFAIKPQLLEERIKQQNGPNCTQLQYQMCLSRGHTEEYCKAIPADSKHCAGCPLYLYGTEGQKVRAFIHTPTYTQGKKGSNEYHVTLLANNKIAVDGETTDRISFDYSPALQRITPPTTGSIVRVSELEITLRQYAAKLGLNANEADDLIADVQQSITSPYIFVSFFDHETSHAILPITFDPKPDTYRNIVFYFKQLSAHPGFTADLPEFEKIERKGFTAVEVSGIVE